MRSLGSLIEEIRLPEAFDNAADLQNIIMSAGIADACHQDYLHSRELMSDVLLGIVETGRKITATDFIAALSARDSLRVVYRGLFTGYDAIVTPAALGIAPRHEEGTGNPIMATLWTLLGAPALTLRYSRA